jgi:hypothetical protein
MAVGSLNLGVGVIPCAAARPWQINTADRLARRAGTLHSLDLARAGEGGNWSA